MSDIMESLGKVSARLSEEAFLSNKGLSNEVGIHVFCYAPEHEMTVRAYFANLKGKSDVPYRLIERDLYKIFLEIFHRFFIINIFHEIHWLSIFVWDFGGHTEVLVFRNDFY